MNFKSEIIVSQTKEQVWNFLNDPTNLVKWDGSVEEVISTSSVPVGVGYTFDTLAPLKMGQKEKMRMSYKIIEHVPNEYSKIELVESKMFRNAVWTMALEPLDKGTKVICEVDFTVEPSYFFLTPVLLLSNKNALVADLDRLKQAIADHYK